VLAAELFSEPPINLMPGRIVGNEVSLAGAVHFPARRPAAWRTASSFRHPPRPPALVPSNDDDLELAVLVEWPRSAARKPSCMCATSTGA
jgi:glycerol transport system ATP-binding protein